MATTILIRNLPVDIQEYLEEYLQSSWKKTNSQNVIKIIREHKSIQKQNDKLDDLNDSLKRDLEMYRLDLLRIQKKIALFHSAQNALMAIGRDHDFLVPQAVHMDNFEK